MPANEIYRDLHFPKAGLDLSRSAMAQPWRQGPPGPDGAPTRVYTSAKELNVRGYDPFTRRLRGGSRCGLSMYVNGAAVDGWLIQHLNTVVGVDPEDAVQGSQLGRVVTGIAVCQGRLFSFQPADDLADRTLTEATNSADTDPPMNFSGIVSSSADNQKLYLVDGTHYRFYTPATNVVDDWTASAGSLPEGSDSDTARLITTWRGRIVLSGLITDSQNWFMSAVTDPRDFDYSPTSQTPTQAVAGNNSRLGFIGDVITALMAYNDDVLLFGGNTSIYAMRGDPMTGGEIDLVTNSIGVAFGDAFTQDPKGNIYFMANTGAIYMMAPGQQPERLSQPIDSLLQQINTGEVAVRLVWDERARGLHVFVTTLAAATLTDRHYFWEYPNNAWHQDYFANKKHNPLASCVIDGNTPEDRVILLGGWDGFIRSIDPSATTDDGKKIESEVWIGPILTKDFDEVDLKSIQGVLAESSGNVDWAIYSGATAEEALAAAEPEISGTWEAGRNLTELVRVSGHAIFIKLSSTDRWAMEAVRGALSPNMSKVRRRGA